MALRPEIDVMALVDACRTPIRRKIMILAQEAYAIKQPVTAKGLSEKLQKPLSNVSYYVAGLAKAGALEVVGGSQKRGAWQKAYAPTGLFQATMSDTVALDRIAELMDGLPAGEASKPNKVRWESLKDELVKIIRATGRPVEA